MMFASWGPYWVKSAPIIIDDAAAIYYYDRYSATTEFNKIAKIGVDSSHLAERLESQAVGAPGQLIQSSGFVVRDFVNERLLTVEHASAVNNYPNRVTSIDLRTANRVWTTRLPGTYVAPGSTRTTTTIELIGCTITTAWVRVTIGDAAVGGWQYGIYGLSLDTGAITHDIKLSGPQNLGGSTNVLLQSLPRQQWLALTDQMIFIGLGLFNAQNGGTGPNYQAYFLNITGSTTATVKAVGPIDSNASTSTLGPTRSVSYQLDDPDNVYIGYQASGTVTGSRALAIVNFNTNAVSYINSPVGVALDVHNVQIDASANKAWLVANANDGKGKVLQEYAYPGFSFLGRYGSLYQGTSGSYTTGGYTTYRVYKNAVLGFGSLNLALWPVGSYTEEAQKSVLYNTVSSQAVKPSYIPVAPALSTLNPANLDTAIGKSSNFIFAPNLTFAPITPAPTVTPISLGEEPVQVSLTSRITWVPFFYDGSSPLRLDRINDGLQYFDGRVLLPMTSSATTDAFAHTFTTTGSASVSFSQAVPGLGTTSCGSFTNTTQASPGFVSSATNADYLLTNNFTVSCWVRFTELTANGNFLFAFDGNAANYMHAAVNVTTGKLTVTYTAASAQSTITSASTVESLTWYHVEVVMVNGELRLYINGVFEGSTTPATLITGLTTMGMQVGSSPYRGTGFGLRGFMGDFTFLQNTAYHTSNFEVPFAPRQNTGDFKAYIYDSFGNYVSFNQTSLTGPVLRLENTLAGMYVIGIVNTLNNFDTVVSPSSNGFRLIVNEPAGSKLYPQVVSLRLVKTL